MGALIRGLISRMTLASAFGPPVEDPIATSSAVRCFPGHGNAKGIPVGLTVFAGVGAGRAPGVTGGGVAFGEAAAAPGGAGFRVCPAA